MKNAIYAAVIGVCILVAILVFVKTRGSDGPQISDDEQVWVICVKCKKSYEMGKKTFYSERDEVARAKGATLAVPLLKCKECGADAVLLAEKCEECGEVFRRGTVPNDFADRCPKCKHSKTEAARKARQ